MTSSQGMMFDDKLTLPIPQYHNRKTVVCLNVYRLELEIIYWADASSLWGEPEYGASGDKTSQALPIKWKPTYVRANQKWNLGEEHLDCNPVSDTT